jgi:hypothetical protein
VWTPLIEQHDVAQQILDEARRNLMRLESFEPRIGEPGDGASRQMRR